jgi:hypothetical protein
VLLITLDLIVNIANFSHVSYFLYNGTMKEFKEGEDNVFTGEKRSR